MNYDDIPINEFHYREILEQLRDQEFIRAGDIYSLSPTIVEYRDSVFGLQSANSLMFCANTKALSPYKFRIHLGHCVGILSMAGGANTLQADGRTAQFRDYSVLLSFNTKVADVVRAMGSSVKNLGIISDPACLIEEYDLNYNLLPYNVQISLRSGSSIPARLLLPLSPRCRIILDSMFSRNFYGVTQYRYLHAKTEELLCELVQHINTINETKLISTRLTRAERRKQSVEAASQIYRQQIGLMPSVDELARLVGINRNIMTDGFKDLFGKTPGEYAREVRLMWAMEQLRDGLYSVTEVAVLSGYSSASAFSRAYSEFFGHSPSDDLGHSTSPK